MTREFPLKPAIICGGETITYSELQRRMDACLPLPVPLLGDSWRGDFRLHTSGTTGRRKEVIISQRAVRANTLNLIEGQGYSPDLVFVIAGDMTHLGCWSKIFPVFEVGATLLVLPDGMRDIDAFLRAFETPPVSYGLPPHTKFATFLVPASLRILLQFSAERLARLAGRIDFIETGAAPMPRADMLRLCRLLPRTRLYNTYASTETGVVATYNFNDGRCLPGCVGRPLPHSSVSVTPEGRIACGGDTLMSGYAGMPGQEGDFVTADSGFFDSEGMLHIEGRVDDMINVGGYKVSPVEVEDAALSHPSVRDCLCVGRSHPVLGRTLLLQVVVKDGCTLDRRELARHIAARVERYKVPAMYEQVDSIRRNANGKAVRSFFS